MYHDQVLTPIKTIYGFNAINITLGLPFIRITPDHGPNNFMLGTNKSNPNSLIKAFEFAQKIKVKLKPNKKLGQNFLIDKNVIKKICNFAYIDKNSDLLEIGPGTGNLTEELLNKKPKHFYVIEKDKNLFESLKEKFQNKIKIFNNDILTFPLEKILNNRTIVFGNLPYNISSKILTRFILNHNTYKFKLLIFMFQKELANRIIAKINKSDYGRLTILSNWRFNIQKIMDISSGSFLSKTKS